MPHFFSKIRQGLLTNNKFTRYLLYAVGEIFLVVIGILIALQVDNWNQERENEEKVRAILSDMLVELETDIKETSRLMMFYEKKDSTIFLSLTNELTEKNFKNNIPDNLFNLATFYTMASLTAEAWTKLMDMSDVIPLKYKELISKLNDFYNNRFGAVMLKNRIMAQITDEYFQILTENYPWYTPKSSDDGSLEKQIDYRLNSYKHRGRIHLWHVQGIENHLQYIIRYRQDALEIHNIIRTLLNIPLFDEEVLFDKDLAKNLQGVWRSNRFPEMEINLRFNEGRLFLNFNEDTISREVFDISDKKLNQFPFIRYRDVEQKNWKGSYPIAFYTIIYRQGEPVLKDYFSEWHKVPD